MYEALNIDFNSEHRLLICRPQGVVDDYSAMQLLNFLLALEEMAEPFNRVADMTLATDISLTSAAIHEYAQLRLRNLAHLEPFRAAIIASSPDSEAVGHLYATLMRGSKIEVGVFRNASAAAEWLGVPEDTLHPQSSRA